jgi:hypothetical protein
LIYNEVNDSSLGETEMLILVDKSNLRMVAAAGSRKWINLVAYVDFPSVDVAIVDSLEGATWTVFDKEQMATLYKNMSGQDAPEYGECIKQLRSYSESWPNYPKTEAQLEAEAESIYQEEQAEAGDSMVEAARQQEEGQRQAHQATIAQAEAQRPNPSIAAQAQDAQPAATKPQAAPKPASNEAPRQGITKKIWEIADELLAVTGQVGNLKEFRSKVIERAVAIGANSGTAATQFGHWKRAKGIQ